MAKKKAVRPPLIVDADPAFLDEIKADPQAYEIPPVIAKTGRDAQLHLATSDADFSGVFINPKSSNPGGLSVIRFAHQFHPSTPIFLLYENAEPYLEKELTQLGVQKALQKPLSYKKIVSMVGSVVDVFDPADALSVAHLNQDPLNYEITEQDAQFIPIRAENFLAGAVSFFDVYIRLTSGKYIKLLQAGDSFSVDRVQNYLKKGVIYFYLRKEAQEFYLNYCDKLTAALLENSQLPIDIKVSQTLNHGEETLKFLQSRGVDDESLRYAADFVTNVDTLVKQLEPFKQPLLAAFLRNITAYEHGSGTTIIAAILAQALSISSHDPIETIGFASLFHDIALDTAQPEQVDEDVYQMTPKQLALFHKHPIDAAERLREVSGIRPATLQAIAQHHERRNRKGFPYHLGPGSISIVSEIVGISDEYYHLIRRIQKDPNINITMELETRIYHCFSTHVVNEFRKTFLFARG